MPVLFVISSNARLATVAADGLKNLMPPNHNQKQQALRSWLLLVTSLVATVTFTAGLSTPRGFWAPDAEDKGYMAGTSVICRLFQTSITLAFFFSLMIIVVLAKSINK